MDEFLDHYIFPYTGKYIGRAPRTADGLPRYTRREERFNTASHILGIFIGFFMIAASVLYGRSDWGRTGGGIFGVTLVILYVASSVYHGTPPEHTAEKKLLRLLDHCSIFILVAGTCTPFILSLIGRSGDWTEWIFYAVVWLIALGGITLLGVDLKRFNSIAIVLYVFMGALLVFRAGDLREMLGPEGLALLLAGGGAYLVGLLFYGLASRHEWMHGVFHVLCLTGSVLHCVCIGAYVI